MSLQRAVRGQPGYVSYSGNVVLVRDFFDAVTSSLFCVTSCPDSCQFLFSFVAYDRVRAAARSTLLGLRMAPKKKSSSPSKEPSSSSARGNSSPSARGKRPKGKGKKSASPSKATVEPTDASGSPRVVTELDDGLTAVAEEQEVEEQAPVALEAAEVASRPKFPLRRCYLCTFWHYRTCASCPRCSEPCAAAAELIPVTHALAVDDKPADTPESKAEEEVR
jgi:ferredoxin